MSDAKGLVDGVHVSDPISAFSSNLGADAGATVEKLGSPALSISDGGAGTAASVVSAVPDAPHIGIVGEATDLTPGHSVDFPAQPVPEGDALFVGTSYTEYHVALNTGVSSGPLNGPTAITTTVTSMHDAASLAPINSPNASHASEPPAPEHSDVSLTQVPNAVDELSVRGQSH